MKICQGISSLVSKFFGHFKIGLFSFYCWVLRFSDYFKYQFFIRYIFFRLFLAYLFILLTVSFTEQKFWIFTYFFLDYAFGVMSKKSSSNSRSSRFSYMLLSRSFIGLCFKFMSMILLELIFAKAVKFISRFIYFFHADVQLFQHCLLRRLSFLHWIACVPLSKISWLNLCESFLGSLLWSLCYYQ